MISKLQGKPSVLLTRKTSYFFSFLCAIYAHPPRSRSGFKTLIEARNRIQELGRSKRSRQFVFRNIFRQPSPPAPTHKILTKDRDQRGCGMDRMVCTIVHGTEYQCGLGRYFRRYGSNSKLQNQQTRLKGFNLYQQSGAYPGGMHRMHVHPPSPPPCASPPGHVHPPSPP